MNQRLKLNAKWPLLVVSVLVANYSYCFSESVPLRVQVEVPSISVLTPRGLAQWEVKFNITNVSEKILEFGDSCTAGSAWQTDQILEVAAGDPTCAKAGFQKLKPGETYKGKFSIWAHGEDFSSFGGGMHFRLGYRTYFKSKADEAWVGEPNVQTLFWSNELYVSALNGK